MKHVTFYTHAFSVSIPISGDTLTWKLSIDGKEVRLLYRAVHRFQAVFIIWKERIKGGRESELTPVSVCYRNGDTQLNPAAARLADELTAQTRTSGGVRGFLNTHQASAPARIITLRAVSVKKKK